ncbi:MAG TPA: type II CAAX endopeptidase family protein [Bryobacteraceae bacterium]|nr:type II CAAX endopeptidase family protein [Bryobacteraceae bacterium]
MPAKPDPVRIALQILVYVVLYLAAAWVCGPLANWLGGYLVGITTTGLVAASLTNGLSLRIFEGLRLPDAGLAWNRTSMWNLGLGAAGGAGSAMVVLCGPLALRAAHFVPVPEGGASVNAYWFLPLLLLAGAAGEELLFRGYGFQVLLRTLGAWATIVPVGLVFAALHAGNPNANWLALANTAGFGILFGYAFLRSHDLWLPIGLHFGWNVTLPLFGVNVSGITMRLTGYSLEWSAGKLWSGGDYGPEASLLTAGVLGLLFMYLYRAPIRRQSSRLLDPPAEGV